MKLRKIFLSAVEFVPHKFATVCAYGKPFYNGYLHRLRCHKNTNTGVS